MGFFDNIFGSAANSVLEGRLGGLNTGVAAEAVGKLLKNSGDAVIRVARMFGFCPDEAETMKFVKEQAAAVGLGQQTMDLLADMGAFAKVWEQHNRSDWEEFCVEAPAELDITPWQPVLDAAQTSPAYARALQAAAELKFPKLYLLRCLAVGVTATNEDWLDRARINTFRTFFLRTALPGDEYDKFIDYYVILTSEKDAWDELRSGQNSKLGFLIDSISNYASTKIASHFESKLGDALKAEFGQAAATEKSGAAAGA